MKKVLMVLGGIFGLIILSFAGMIIYAIIIGGGLDEESKTWVDNTVPQIIEGWDVDFLVENSSPELLEVATRDDTDALFSRFSSELGDFKEYKGSEGQAGIHINNGRKTITAEYIATAEFERSDAQILIRGIKREDGWKILNFHINIPLSQD